MFCGREDVFARRWYSKTTEKSGYQPVCENEWADGLCDKRKYKCSACLNRKLSPITDEDIYKHLEGKDYYARDVETAQNEILIISPFMRKARLTQMLKVLSPLIMNKVTVTVVTRPPEDFKDKNKQIVIDCTEQ